MSMQRWLLEVSIEGVTFFWLFALRFWACSADCWGSHLGSKKYKVFDTWDCSVKASIMRRLAQKRCHLDHSKIDFFSALHALRWIVQHWLLRLKVVPSFAAEGEPCRCYLLLAFCLAFLSVQRWLLEGGTLFVNCFAFLSVQRWLLRVAASTDSISLGKPFQEKNSWSTVQEPFFVYVLLLLKCLINPCAT